jgi:UDP-glucose 4-epimerase
MAVSWLITGGCGFIGRNLVADLVSEGEHFIRIVDNLKIGSRDDLASVCEYKEICRADILGRKIKNQGVELVVGDIMDDKLAIDASKGVDVIVHLAANSGVYNSVKNPRMDCETNVIGTLNYLEAARHSGTKRFIFASSSAPAGEVTPPIHEELPPHPVSPYGASKLAGEGYCSAYYRTFNLETVCLRFGNVYGPHSENKESVIAKIIKKALSGESVEIYGDGGQTRDFIHAYEIVRAIRLASTTLGIGGETFQIATNKEHTVNEVAEMLKYELKSRLGIDMVLTWGQPRKGDVRRNYSDTTKAKQILGFENEKELKQGLQEIVKWFIFKDQLN